MPMAGAAKVGEAMVTPVERLPIVALEMAQPRWLAASRFLTMASRWRSGCGNDHGRFTVAVVPSHAGTAWVHVSGDGHVCCSYACVKL